MTQPIDKAKWLAGELRAMAEDVEDIIDDISKLSIDVNDKSSIRFSLYRAAKELTSSALRLSPSIKAKKTEGGES